MTTATNIQVKDMSFTMVILVASCMFPVVFFLMAEPLELGYLLATVVTLIIYSAGGILFIRKLKRDENVYALTASQASVTILKHGTFRWDEISGIETFCEIPFGRRSPHKYIKLTFFHKNEIVMDASNFDTDYIDLKEQLLKLRSNANQNS